MKKMFFWKRLTVSFLTFLILFQSFSFSVALAQEDISADATNITDEISVDEVDATIDEVEVVEAEVVEDTDATTELDVSDCQECQDYVIKVKETREALRAKRNEFLKELEYLAAKLFELHKLKRLTAAEFEEQVLAAGGQLGEDCRADLSDESSIEDNSDLSDVEAEVEDLESTMITRHLFGDQVFCFDNEEQWEDFVESMKDKFGGEYRALLEEIHEIIQTLNKLRGEWRELLKAYRDALKELRDCHNSTETCIKPIFLLWNWGYIKKLPTDKSPYEWEGSVTIDDGTVQVVKRVLYEQNDTVPTGPTEPAESIDLSTVTTVHWDGLLLKVVPSSTDDADNSVVFTINGEERRYSIPELNKVHELYEIDGRQTALNRLRAGRLSNVDLHDIGATPFCDFDGSEWFAQDVRFLKDAGIVSGDAGKCTFRPADSVSRAEVLKMAIEAAGDAGLMGDEDPDFKDSVNHWARKYIAFALMRRYVTGYSDGFRPDQAVTRGEAVKIIFNVMGIKPDRDDLASAFPDTRGHWSAALIAYARELGIVVGDPDGNFRPNEPINRAEVAKLIRASLDYVSE